MHRDDSMYDFSKKKKNASSEPLELESPKMPVANASFGAEHAPGKQDAECLHFLELLGVMMPRGARASAWGLSAGGPTLVLIVIGGRQAVCLDSSWQAVRWHHRHTQTIV